MRIVFPYDDTLSVRGTTIVNGKNRQQFPLSLYQPLCILLCFLLRELTALFTNMRTLYVQKPPSQLRFWLPSIIITITGNEPWNRETHKTDRNHPITNQKPWSFGLVKVKFSFLRSPLRWLTAAKNAIVIWLLNFRIRMFVKSALTKTKRTTKWLTTK